MREGPWRTQRWSTQLVDARTGQLLDIVEGRDATAPAVWLDARDPQWLAGIRWAVMDMSGPYKAVFDTMLPDAEVVIDPFHVVKHANSKLDECRRRVQNETLGHRGHKTRSPLSMPQAAPQSRGTARPRRRHQADRAAPSR